MATSILIATARVYAPIATLAMLAGCAASHPAPMPGAATARTDRSSPPARAGARVPSPYASTRPGPPRAGGQAADRPGAPAIAVVPPAPGAPGMPQGTALRADDGPLTAKIERTTSASRAAALRLTQQAREHLARGEVPRAVELLERAVAVDARTPYAYYFLAEAHERGQKHALARSFAARAEQLFAGEPYWLARAQTLRGRIAEAEGRTDEARAAYARALATWPRNDAAASGLVRLDARGQGAR